MTAYPPNGFEGKINLSLLSHCFLVASPYYLGSYLDIELARRFQDKLVQQSIQYLPLSEQTPDIHLVSCIIEEIPKHKM